MRKKLFIFTDWYNVNVLLALVLMVFCFEAHAVNKTALIGNWNSIRHYCEDSEGTQSKPQSGKEAELWDDYFFGEDKMSRKLSIKMDDGSRARDELFVLYDINTSSQLSYTDDDGKDYVVADEMILSPGDQRLTIKYFKRLFPTLCSKDEALVVIYFKGSIHDASTREERYAKELLERKEGQALSSADIMELITSPIGWERKSYKCERGEIKRNNLHREDGDIFVEGFSANGKFGTELRIKGEFDKAFQLSAGKFTIGKEKIPIITMLTEERYVEGEKDDAKVESKKFTVAFEIDRGQLKMRRYVRNSPTKPACDPDVLLVESFEGFISW